MFSKLLGLVKVVLEVLAFAPAVTKLLKLEKTVKALTIGIENYSKQPGGESEGKRIKSFIKTSAEAAGVEDYLHKKIVKFTKRQWEKLF